MRRRTILYVATEDWYFVSDTLPLARAARDHGYEVHVATRAGDQFPRISSNGLTFHPLDRISRSQINPLAQAASVAELRRLIGKLRPDLVHNIALKPTLYGLLAARDAARTAVVNSIMGLGYIFASTNAKARVLRPIIRRVLQATLARERSLTLLQNTDDLAALSAMAPSAAERLRLVKGSGVDIEIYKPTPEPEGPPVVALAGRLLGDKGLGEFVEAARLLKGEGVNARFVLVGEPDPDNHASISRQQLQAWVSAGLVEHWGFRTDMAAVHAATTIACLPSYREGLPRILLEAAASARAIVTTDVPGCREVVRPAVNGWLVPPRDPIALAHAVKEAILDPAQRRTYAAAGRRLVEDEFAAPIIIGKTLALYEELLQGR